MPGAESGVGLLVISTPGSVAGVVSGWIVIGVLLPVGVGGLWPGWATQNPAEVLMWIFDRQVLSVLV